MNKKLYKHRIIPGHMGGEYTIDNIKMVTLEDHAEEHRLLFEKYGKQEDKFAWLALSGQIKDEKLHLQKSILGGKISGLLNKGKVRSQKTKEKYRDYAKSRIIINNGIVEKHHKKDQNIPEGFIQGRLINLSGENNPMWNKKHKRKTKKLISEKAKGRPSKLKGRSQTEEHIRKVIESNIGKHSGKRNSQYGTWWITNGIEKMKIKANSIIPKGYKRGMK